MRKNVQKQCLLTTGDRKRSLQFLFVVHDFKSDFKLSEKAISFESQVLRKHHKRNVNTTFFNLTVSLGKSCKTSSKIQINTTKLRVVLLIVTSRWIVNRALRDLLRLGCDVFISTF